MSYTQRSSRGLVRIENFDNIFDNTKFQIGSIVWLVISLVAGIIGASKPMKIPFVKDPITTKITNYVIHMMFWYIIFPLRIGYKQFYKKYYKK